jgi:hypothetical protein
MFRWRSSSKAICLRNPQYLFGDHPVDRLGTIILKALLKGFGFPYPDFERSGLNVSYLRFAAWNGHSGFGPILILQAEVTN